MFLNTQLILSQLPASNRRPTNYELVALPSELNRHKGSNLIRINPGG